MRSSLTFYLRSPKLLVSQVFHSQPWTYSKCPSGNYLQCYHFKNLPSRSRTLPPRDNRLPRLAPTLAPSKSSTVLTEASSLSEKPKVVVITGPTAVGKTDASLLVAEALDGEIISADSVQVYRGLDIGSAKIREHERRGIPHHLIDVLDPSQEFSAGHFYDLARRAIHDILKRGKVPVIVGGTGFYLRWCIHGKPQTPPADPQAAQKVQDFIQKVRALAVEKHASDLNDSLMWEEFCSAIEKLGDQESASRLRTELNNEYRLKRVLSILLTTGRPLAEMNHDRLAEPDYDFRCFFLNRPRKELYDRIGLRCEQMLLDGLLQEAAWMLDQGLVGNTNCATKSIGYRQALEFLEEARARGKSPSCKDLMQMLLNMQAKSRNLCHSQLAWFRDEAMFKWLDATKPIGEVAAEIVEGYRLPQNQGNTFEVGVLSKEEAKAMKGYLYQQQLICRPGVPDEILSKLKICGEKSESLSSPVMSS